MQNLKKLIAMMLMLASVFFIACNDDNDDEGTNPLTVAEAQQEFTQLGTEMSGMIADMEEVEGVDVMMMMSNLPDPFSALGKSTANGNAIKNIEKYILPNTILSKEKSNLEEVGFDFEYYKGIYTYYHTPIPRWEWVDDADKIEINFPSDEVNMETNDAKLTISSYSEVMITEYDDDWGEYYYDYEPNDIDASLELNSIEIVSIDMSATWVTSGDAAGEPTALNVDVYLLPFDFHVDFTHASTTVDVNAWINYDGATIFAVGLDAVFASTNMDDPPVTIGGYIQLFDVRFDVDLNFAAFMLIIQGMDSDIPVYTTPEALETAINATLDASVSVDGAEAADIIIDVITLTPAEGELPIDVLFVYNDGTSESAIPYFAGFVTQVMEFLGGMEDFYF